MNTRKNRTGLSCAFALVCFLLVLGSCAESERYKLTYDDSTPPGKPVLDSIIALPGGARIYFHAPADEDVLSISCEHVATSGKTIKTSVSYMTNWIEIFGFTDTIVYEVKFYAQDRADNRSEELTVHVKPMEAPISLVSKNVAIKPGFGALVVQWANSLKQSLRAYVDIEFEEAGVKKTLSSAFSSSADSAKLLVKGLDSIPAGTPVNVKVTFADLYGNMQGPIDMGMFELLVDTELPKSLFTFPYPGELLGIDSTIKIANRDTTITYQTVKMINGSWGEGEIRYLVDGLINNDAGFNYMMVPDTTVAPWNIIIDLGDYYTLSRIITHQRRNPGTFNQFSRGLLYADYNIGRYKMYRWDDQKANWVLLHEVKIPLPVGASEFDIIKAGILGDMEYMYPLDPQYTVPTRKFRFQALYGFGSNYTSTKALYLSELTLYGLKVP